MVRARLARPLLILAGLYLAGCQAPPTPVPVAVAAPTSASAPTLAAREDALPVAVPVALALALSGIVDPSAIELVTYAGPPPESGAALALGPLPGFTDTGLLLGLHLEYADSDPSDGLVLPDWLLRVPRYDALADQWPDAEHWHDAGGTPHEMRLALANDGYPDGIALRCDLGPVAVIAEALLADLAAAGIQCHTHGTAGQLSLAYAILAAGDGRPQADDRQVPLLAIPIHGRETEALGPLFAATRIQPR
jgi:hypothetical protein